MLMIENASSAAFLRGGEHRESAMIKIAKTIIVLAVSVAALTAAAERPARAITVELAKKCRAMAIKAHPYKMPGVPGQGTGAAERTFFNDCIARGGNMPDENASGGQSGAGQGAGQTAAPPPPAKP
jgi:hypothetical protein